MPRLNEVRCLSQTVDHSTMLTKGSRPYSSVMLINTEADSLLSLPSLPQHTTPHHRHGEHTQKKKRVKPPLPIVCRQLFSFNLSQTEVNKLLHP
jgi:hypothetical protein